MRPRRLSRFWRMSWGCGSFSLHLLFFHDPIGSVHSLRSISCPTASIGNRTCVNIDSFCLHAVQHWKLGHILRNLVLANAVLLCQMALFTLVQHNERVLADFGFVKHRPALARFVLFTVRSLLTRLPALLSACQPHCGWVQAVHADSPCACQPALLSAWQPHSACGYTDLTSPACSAAVPSGAAR